jgi:hypothetical protein
MEACAETKKSSVVVFGQENPIFANGIVKEYVVCPVSAPDFIGNWPGCGFPDLLTGRSVKDEPI